MQLTDGTEIEIRPLVAADRAHYIRGVEQGMSPQSRYLRFASPKPHLSPREATYLTDVDGTRHVALLAIAPDGHGIGVVRYVVDDGGSAEFAIGVVDAWQGRGLGGALLSRALAHARAHGVARMTATTLAENRAAIGMLNAAGFALRERDGAQLTYVRELRVAPATSPGARPGSP